MKRYHSEVALLDRRAKENRRLRDMVIYTKWSKGRFRKRKPLDCGKTGCSLCHADKVFSEKTMQECRSDIDFKEARYAATC